MGKVYDDWERVVEAVLRREKLRQLCYAHSVSSSDSSWTSSLLDHDFLLHQAKMAMVRLQEELIYVLSENKQCLEHVYLSLPISVKDEESSASVDTPLRQSSSSESVDLLVELLDPDTIPRIEAIADIMFASNNDKEFCEVFVRFGKGAFGVYFTLLDVEDLSSEDISRSEFLSWDSSINKWRLAIKKFIGVYVYEAKTLFDRVLGEYGHVSSSCLIEALKPSLMWFLNFSRAAAIGFRPHQPEKIFSLLDMYQDLVELAPYIEGALFTNEMGSCVMVDLHNILEMLEDCVKLTLVEFENFICTNSSSIPYPNGGIHSLTRYVMNYITHFANYDHTLSSILKEKDGEDVNPNHEQTTLVALSSHLTSITSALEARIAKMSDLYADTSLKHIFLMNNIHYMVAKIDCSQIKAHFGDEWIKWYTMNFRVHALSYQRNTWSFILHLIHRDYDRKMDKTTFHTRCRKFTMAVRNVHEKQKRWLVPNHQLRQELRISASITLVSAYLCFLGYAKNVLWYKHIKYCANELETLIMDLFEGSL